MNPSTNEKKPIQLSQYAHVHQYGAENSYVSHIFLILHRQEPSVQEFEKSLAVAAGSEVKEKCIYSLHTKEDWGFYIWAKEDWLFFGFTLTTNPRASEPWEERFPEDWSFYHPSVRIERNPKVEKDMMWAFREIFSVQRHDDVFTFLGDQLEHDGGVWDPDKKITGYRIFLPPSENGNGLAAVMGRYDIRFGTFYFKPKNKRNVRPANNS